MDEETEVETWGELAFAPGISLRGPRCHCVLMTATPEHPVKTDVVKTAVILYYLQFTFHQK